MPRPFDGSRFSIAFLGGAVTAAFLLLVLSGHLPPRGLVSGDVSVGIGGQPLAGQPVIFERIDGPDIVAVGTDIHGPFSATLPPGHYYVDEEVTGCARFGPCADRRHFYPIGPPVFTIAAGQHVELRLGTCGSMWQQCPGGLAS